jgi:hypothetical protein
MATTTTEVVRTCNSLCPYQTTKYRTIGISQVPTGNYCRGPQTDWEFVNAPSGRDCKYGFKVTLVNLETSLRSG